MGEPAVKEPSMEDILSSIRKIISEEGNEAVVAEAPVVASPEPVASQMADVVEQVRAIQPEPVVANVASSEISGNEAAKMAASLASIAETVKAEVPEEIEVYAEPEMVEPAMPEQSVWDDVEPVMAPEPVAAPQEAAPSLASIAETVVEQVEVPTMTVSEPEAIAEPEIQVEMAQAMPAPEPIEAPVAELSTSAVETMVEEEMAFKGALMSPSSDGAVSGAFDRLKRSAMDDIDAKTEAILRPMLREWLDENLPNMVERLVREEIERVARGV